MLILRKLLKIILLPMLILLFFIRWAVELAAKITSLPFGLLTKAVGVFIVYCLFVGRWSELLILIPIEIAVFTAGAACVLLQGICDILSDKIKMI